jgi:SAM-dependent methyltransferase
VTVNPFSTDEAARIYAAGRPDYAPVVSEIIGRLTGITEPVELAVDVGSGTGISTAALAPLARRTVGVEQSRWMVANARCLDNVSYVVANAEALPLSDDCCDLIGVGAALHWFDQERFLSEAERIARRQCSLVVHNHWFMGSIDGRADFTSWMHETYLTTYPSPPRDRTWQPPEHLGNWRHVAWERYGHTIAMSPVELAAYLLTQSNLQVVHQEREQSVESLRSWLLEEMEQFFDGAPKAPFAFGGFVAVHDLRGFVKLDVADGGGSIGTAAMGAAVAQEVES